MLSRFVLRVLLGCVICFGNARAELPSADQDGSWQIIGTGYRPGSDEVLFYEYHRFILDSEGFIVGRYIEYHLPDHSLKSVKELSYEPTRPPWLPSFRYQDREVGYEVGVDVSADHSSRLYRYSERTSLEETYEPLNDHTVIDAGFDAYIQYIWPELMKGEAVEFEFLAPLKLDRYGFELIYVGDQEGVCELEMRLDWWLVDLLIDPIILQYDCASRQLLRYQGLTNLRNVDHKQYKADIHYRWLTDFPPFRFQ